MATTPTKYNPPPNWPPPPAGWRPPEGWQPDPSWGPAPHGWQVWLPAKKPVSKLGVGLIVVGALLGIGAIAAIAGGGGDKKPATLSGVGGSQSSSSTSSSSSSSSSSSTTAAPPTPTVYRYHGHGNRVIRIRKPVDPDDNSARLISFTHTGRSNFIVTPLDSSLHDNGGSLANQIGRWSGTTLLDADSTQPPTARLKIEADGNWTVTIRLISAAPQMGRTAHGTGTRVLLYNGAAGVAKFTHTGQSNFIVDFINSDGQQNLVNEIGRFSGETTIGDGPGLVVIDADGKWTISIS